ncbi:MAG: outer membrane lipoprotein-sorting protein, partial [Candidatus Omnitrophica bacterium]|nr:outer membrane lipoprotein-sorting protein [Candidatus Omnitrophota bacterium]
MKKAVLFLSILLFLSSYALATELEYFKVYRPHDGMSADQIMEIEYHIKYTKFAKDASFGGKAYFVDKSGFVREKETFRKRITLGRKSDDIAYKDLVIFISPQVKGMGTLTWTYMDAKRQPDSWIWLPSLKRIRKISSANSDDSFLGADFTVEDILLRRFEDETYTLLRTENFGGYLCEFDKKTYYQGRPCFVIECKPKRSPWYYAKRILWVDKNTGAGIYEEKYDARGRKFMTLFKNFEIFNVDGKAYPVQTIIEGKDLRTGHRTTIINTD